MIWIEDIITVICKYAVIFGFAYFGAHIIVYVFGIGG